MIKEITGNVEQTSENKKNIYQFTVLYSKSFTHNETKEIDKIIGIIERAVKSEGMNPKIEKI